MTKFNIVPTPQSITVGAGEKILPLTAVKTVYIEKHLKTDCFEAVKFLPDYTETDPASADLLITDDLQKAAAFCEIDRAWFTNRNAEEQGYIIKSAGGKMLIFAPGRMGIMYGICTFIQIPRIPAEFEIKDYPDFRYRANKWLVWAETAIMSYDFGDGEQAFLARVERKLDMCLKYKVNMVFFDACGPDTERTPQYKRIMKACNALARKRGIYLITCAYTMGYGLSAHPFGKFYGKVYKNRTNYPNGEEYECMGTFIHNKRNGGVPFILGREFGTCISNDALTEDKLEELCNFIKEVNPGALYLHNMDSCYIDERLWMARCDGCRKRWPNDDLFAEDGMAGAFAYFFDKLNGALKTVKTEDYDSAKDLVLFNVAPGYMEHLIDDDKVLVATRFWAAVKRYAKVTENVIPLFRELFYNKEDTNLRVPTVLEKNLGGDFGIISFAGGDGFYSDKLFCITGAFSYMFKGAEAVISCSGHAFSEPTGLLNAEYMWNSENSAFYNMPRNECLLGEFDPVYKDYRVGKIRPEEIYRPGGILDVICQKLYGNNAEAMYRLFCLCGENGEAPAPYPCNKETFTAGNQVLLAYRWDNELTAEQIEEFISAFDQVQQLNEAAQNLLDGCKDDPDLAGYGKLLKENTTFVTLLYAYMRLYKRIDAFLRGEEEDEKALTEELSRLARDAREGRQTDFVAVDAMGGANARREELFDTLAYNLRLMRYSLESGKRIPDQREEPQDENWW